jgi:hypothetical protein
MKSIALLFTITIFIARGAMAETVAFCRIHKTLRVTPAMEAGLTDRVWSIEDIGSLLDVEKAPTRGRHKKAK